MKIICMIPARYASRRFEGKALADINGKPMIQRVYMNAKAYGRSDLITVVTDDERIAKVVNGFGGNVIMTKPDNRTGTDRVAEAAEILKLKDQDIVVNIQGDQPCFIPSHIAEIVDLLRKDSGLQVATLAYKIRHEEEIDGSNSVKVVFDKDNYAIYFSRWPIPYRRNGQGPPYYKHLGIYAYRRSFLREYARMPSGALEMAESLEQLRILENGYRIKLFITLHDSPSVDVPEDLGMVKDIVTGYGGCAG